MNRDLILLHLSLIDGVGPVTIQNLVGKLASNFVNDLYTLNIQDFMQIFGFSSNIASKIYFGLRDVGMLEKEVINMTKNGVQFVTFESEYYPKALKNIYASPVVLYVKSNLNIACESLGVNENSGVRENSSVYKSLSVSENLGKSENLSASDALGSSENYWQNLLNYDKKIAFVGSRQANNYGQNIIDSIIPQVVSNDWVIVSGGAIGADTMAHKCTLKSGGKTIAVIGSGLLNPYPSTNKKLFDDIVDNGGLIVSPFGMDTVARPGNFPARNRVIAGLSLGCVVVQAAKKSGASITAQFALEQGREVFAVPGKFDDELSAGCHALISQGAKITSCAQDIICEFPDYLSSVTAKISNKNEFISGLENAKNSLSIEEALKYESKKSQAYTERKDNKNISKSVNIKFDRNFVEGFGSKIGESLAQGTIEFEIINICKKASSIDEIAVATNKDIQDLHEVLFDLQISGQIKQNYAGMFETI